MALVRVVSFDGVSRERAEELRREFPESPAPEGLPAREVLMLYDPESERSLVLVFFENEDDYRRGDELLAAMPAGDTPGRRTSVERYDELVRVTM